MEIFMKLKYYIRGVGIGVIITTFVFMIANLAGVFSSTEKVISETETKATSSVLAYATNASTEQDKQATTIATVSTKENTSNDDETTQSDDETTQSDDETQSNNESELDETNEQSSQEVTTRSSQNNQNSEDDREFVEVEIRNIKYVSEVSEILYDMGIISDVSEFNSFMTFSGNDLKVKEGRYKLKPGDTFENIASVITRSE